MQQRYNAIIIGFGKGGKTLAAYLADQGQSVAIVERSDKMYGGTCINIACIPTKTLVYEAHKSLSLIHILSTSALSWPSCMVVGRSCFTSFLLAE